MAWICAQFQNLEASMYMFDLLQAIPATCLELDEIYNLVTEAKLGLQKSKYELCSACGVISYPVRYSFAVFNVEFVL